MDVQTEVSAKERHVPRPLVERSAVERPPVERESQFVPMRAPHSARQEWQVQRQIIRDGSVIVTLVSASSPGTNRELRQIRIQTDSQIATLGQLSDPFHEDDRSAIGAITRVSPGRSTNSSFATGVGYPLLVQPDRTIQTVQPDKALDFVVNAAPALGSDTLRAISALLLRPEPSTQVERHIPLAKPEAYDIGKTLDPVRKPTSYEPSLELLATSSKSPSFLQPGEKTAEHRRENFITQIQQERLLSDSILSPAEAERLSNRRLFTEVLMSEGPSESTSLEQADPPQAAEEPERPSVLETIGRAKIAESEAYRDLGQAIHDAVSTGAIGTRDVIGIGSRGEFGKFREQYQAPDRYSYGGRYSPELLPIGFGPAAGDSKAVTEMKDFYRHVSSNARMVQWATKEIMESEGVSLEEATQRAVNLVSLAGWGNEMTGLVRYDLIAIPGRLMSGQQLLQAYEEKDLLNNALGMILGSDPNFNVDLFEARAHIEIEMQRLEELSEGLLEPMSEKSYSLGVSGVSSTASQKQYSLGINYESVFESEATEATSEDVEGGSDGGGAWGSGAEDDAGAASDQQGSEKMGGFDEGGHGHPGDTGGSGGNQGGGEQGSGGTCNSGNDPASTGGECTSGGGEAGGESGGDVGGEGGEGGGGEGGGGGGGCFLTTACLRSLSVEHAETLLDELRMFRDLHVNLLPEGPGLIAEYYSIAPQIVRRIEARPDARALYQSVFEGLVTPLMSLVRDGQTATAVELYKQYVRELRDFVEAE